jgi:hypothetical protein
LIDFPICAPPYSTRQDPRPASFCSSCGTPCDSHHARFPNNGTQHSPSSVQTIHRTPNNQSNPSPSGPRPRASARSILDVHHQKGMIGLRESGGAKQREDPLGAMETPANMLIFRPKKGTCEANMQWDYEKVCPVSLFRMFDRLMWSWLVHLDSCESALNGEMESMPETISKRRNRIREI